MLAAGLVKQIQAGCNLYREAKTQFIQIKKTGEDVGAIYKEVTGFWSNFSNFFKPKSTRPKPVAKAKQKEKYIAVDETQVMSDIVSQLTEFFKLQEQLAVHIREEEEKSRNVYDPNTNLMEAALKRIMAQQQMAALEVTIRETMVYQSPPEMGALYSKVFEMREVIGQEQEQARLEQETQQRYKQWQRREAKRNFQAKSAYLVVTAIFLLYVWLWLLLLNRWETT